MPKMRRQDKLKAEYKRPITEDWHTSGKLIDGTDCKVILDTGESNSFMSTTFYLECPSSKSLLKFVSKRKESILVGNGQYIKCIICHTCCD